jgi:hypothetical protein
MEAAGPAAFEPRRALFWPFSAGKKKGRAPAMSWALGAGAAGARRRHARRLHPAISVAGAVLP